MLTDPECRSLPSETMLLIAPMDAGITHSRCTFWDYAGEILLIILWMSYFLYPQLVSLSEARENRFASSRKGKISTG
jgi:hypothetical protein